MRLPDSVVVTAQRVAAKYPGRRSHTDFALALNEIAWEHRAEGFGLSRKTGGKHVVHPVVGPIAEDILQLPDGTHWDIFGGADDNAPMNPPDRPMDSIVPNTPREWVAPVDPRVIIGAPEPALPVPTPTPIPVPTPCACAAQCGEVERVVRETEAALHKLIAEKVIAEQFGFIRKELTRIEGKLDQLLGKPGCRWRF